MAHRDHERQPQGDEAPRRRAPVRAVARRQEAAGPQGRRSVHRRRRRQGADASSTRAKSGCRRGPSARSARRVAADVRRGVAAGARLLLRPRHARRRLERRCGRSTCRWSTASPSARELSRPDRADGRRAVGAAHLRPRRRPAPRRPTTSSRAVARRATARAIARPAAIASTTSTAPIPDYPERALAAGPIRASTSTTGDVIAAINGIAGADGRGIRARCCATRPAGRCCCG